MAAHSPRPDTGWEATSIYERDERTGATDRKGGGEGEGKEEGGNKEKRQKEKEKEKKDNPTAVYPLSRTTPSPPLRRPP